jgi:dehydrogenase/reductase SDR family protein 1
MTLCSPHVYRKSDGTSHSIGCLPCLFLKLVETPQFTGRAVVAIATDPNNHVTRSGVRQVVAELAEVYGFDDVNGNRPPSIRSLRFLLPCYGMTEEQRKTVPIHRIPDWKLPFWVMGMGQPPAKRQ